MADIFTASIRDDILNGFDKEVFRKCSSIARNLSVSGLVVRGLGGREICIRSPGKGNRVISVENNIYFNPDRPEIAGQSIVYFQNNLAQKIISQVILLLFGAAVALLLGYWAISKYLLSRETRKFTHLAELLSASEVSRLQNCKDFFPGVQTIELSVLCDGVEKLALNWRAYQKELVRNERLKAIHQSSRVLAHDIKSPLGALKTVSHTLVQQPEKSKKLLDRGIERIESMLLDLVNKKETDKAVIEAVDLKDFFGRIREDLQVTYGGHENISLNFVENVPGGMEMAKFDPKLVERALKNLVKNSFEAVTKGFVEVTVNRTESEFNFIVRDSGPGIPQDLVSQIGEAELASSKETGSGLGLYQVKETMELHLGELEVTVNDGTQIKLNFPC